MRRPWPRHSVRTRLTLWYTLTLTVGLGLYVGGVFFLLHYHLANELDRQLRQDFEVAERMLEWTAEGGMRWHADPRDEDEEYGNTMQWIEVWSHEGTLVHRHSASGNVDLGLLPAWSQGSPRLASLTGVGEIHVRILSDALFIGGRPAILRVARSEEPLRHELRTVLLVLLLGLPVAVSIAGVGGYTLARRALAPVSRMTDQARMITVERLGERLPIDNPDDELGHLARVFNETFARLEQSFEQMRRFTADASHELRTPLTALRSVGEVGVQAHRDEQAYREIIGSMLEEVDRLSRLVDNLLTLSRADARRVRLAPEQVELGALARDVANYLGVLAEEKRQSITIEAREPVSTWVDRLMLRQALINLVDNAVKYSPEGTCIRLVVSTRPAGPTVEVIDQGPGIAPEDREHVFERFFRLEKARSLGRGSP